MPYNWQQEDWPNFKYDLSVVEEDLYAFAESLGRVSGMIYFRSFQIVLNTFQFDPSLRRIRIIL
jgi:Fic family protein